jgi:predicted Zn-dependent peptidase
MFFTSAKLYAQEKVEFVEYDLDNGLHVILHQDKTNPIACVDIWYHVGSKDEDTNRTGFAHLFEHMMFQGSQNVGKAEHFSYIQKAGGTLNGTTNQDRTNYFESVPSNQLELVLWLESDRMSTLNVTQENFDNQREVVKEEKRQRYDNVPYGSRFFNLFRESFPGQTYNWIPIGSMEDLNDAELDYAQNFYKRFYSPNNSVLVVAGDIDYDKTKILVQKYFGSLKRGPEVKRNYKPIIFNSGEVRDTIYEKVQLPALYIGYKIPAVTSEETYALNLLSSILTSGRSSRLYNELVYKKQFAKSVGSFVWDLELGGLFIINAIGMKNSNLKEIEDIITSEIEKVKSEMVSAHELEKVKNEAESDYLNRLQTIMGKADMLANYYTFFKNPDMINRDLNRVLKVTEEDILNESGKYLNSNNRVVLYYLPENSKNVINGQ